MNYHDFVKLLSLHDFKSYLLRRPRECHKHQFGHILIIGGEEGYSGSVLLAAKAALRTGAGLVSIATRKTHAIFLNINQPELMCHGILNKKDLMPLLNKASVIVLGPGLSQKKWGKNLFNAAFSVKKPLIVDADGLNILATKKIKSSWFIITPHVGEAARLLNITSEEIQADRLNAVKALQKKYGCIVVLKGSQSLICNEKEEVFVCPFGNPGMASAGTGDVLTGIIAGLAAQHVPLEVAAKLGVLLHAQAGDLAAQEGERGMIASDIIHYLRQLIN